MKRRHLFEWEDLPWFPSSIRNLITDYLRYVVVKFRMFESVLPTLERLLETTGQNKIVDLCSGGGGPWRALVPRLQETHPQLSLKLTDLYPNVASLEMVRQVAPKSIEVVTESVDASEVPPSLEGLRTQFLSLHHFQPQQVKAIFQNAVEAKQAIAVFEFQARDWSHLIQFALSPIFVLLFIRPLSFNRIFWTYIIPVVPFCVMWDGVVSVLRTYTVNEIEEIVDSIPESDSYHWEVRSEKVGQVTVFSATGYLKQP